MSVTIESLELQLNTNSTSAANGLNLLSASLSKIKNSIKGGLGLNATIGQLRDLNSTLNGINDQTTTNKIDKLANSLSKLSSLSNIKISSSIGKQLSVINSSLNNMNISNSGSLEKLANSIKPLSDISRAEGIKAVVTQLSKIPPIMQKLEGVNTDVALNKIIKFTDALSKVGNANSISGFTKLGNSFVQSINKISSTSSKGSGFLGKFSTSATELWSKIKLVKGAIGKFIEVVGGFVNESNAYVENLNLFQVSMGKYADEAQRYAEKVSEILGIDPGEFMRNQGVFMTISEGFGIASDRAYKMSKNLTQLGYDLSSFFNIPIENAMQKLTSGISGELEPLRRLGYDLSQARLKADALSLGIRKSFNEMTQAEKAQLRYHAIMTQVTKVQGDMARTLSAPANQLRVFNAQIKMVSRSIGNIFIPILNLVLPYLIAFFKILRTVFDFISGLVGFKLPSIDTSSINAGAKAMGDLSENTGNVGSGVDDANKKIKEMKNAVLGIDELNIISEDTQDSLDGMKNGIGDIGAGLGGAGFDLPEYDFLGDLLESNIATFQSYLSAFMIVLGTILVLTNANIPIGLALMAMGAVGLVSAVSANWNTMSEELAKTLALVTIMLGTFFFALGVFMLITGNIPMGIALMVAGFASIGASVAINFGKLKGDLGTMLQQIMGVVAGFMFAIGTILLMAGPTFVPYGIALLVAGVVTFIAAANVNWGGVIDTVKDVLAKFGKPVGMVAFVIGLILVCTGVGLPIGLALMAAGAVAFIMGEEPDFGEIGKIVKDGIDGLCNIVGKGIKAGLDFVGGLFNGAKDLVCGIADGVGDFVGGVVDGAKNLAKGAIDGVSNFASGAVDTVSKGVSGTVDFVKDKATKFVDTTKDVLKGVGDAATNAGKFVAEKAGEIADGVGKTIHNVGDKVSQFASNVVDTGVKWGKGILDGIGGVFNGVKNWVADKITGPITNAVDTSPPPEVNVKILDQAHEWWENLKTFFKTQTTDGLEVSAKLQIAKDGWDNIPQFIGDIKPIKQEIELEKKGWKSVENWIGDINDVQVGVALKKSNWEHVKGWIGNLPDIAQGIGLAKKGWSTVKSWIGDMPTLFQDIALAKKDWKNIPDWIGYHVVPVYIRLEKKGWSRIEDFIGRDVTVGVNLKQGADYRSNGGYYNGNKYSEFANGGFIKQGKSSMWNSIPRYANGTSNVRGHGSLFIAGESGAEMVGHINGQTEVLNQSQIKLAMRSAVISGMAQFVGYWRNIDNRITNACNSIIRAILINTAAMSTNTMSGSYYPMHDMSSSFNDDNQSNLRRNSSSQYDSIRDLVVEHISPLMREIATNTKIQADKNEQTIVQIGNRTITDAVTTQKKANGYVFHD